MKKTALLLTVTALVLGACGQGDPTSVEVASLDDSSPVSAEASEPATVDPETAMLAMAACMRDQGVDVADPEVDEDGNVQPPRPVDPASIDRATLLTAREACAEHLEGIEFGFQSVDQTELEDTLLSYATCMRDNGYDMPDPDVSAIGAGPGQSGEGPFGELDRSDPDFAAAQDACQDVLGEFGSRGIGAGPGGRGA